MPVVAVVYFVSFILLGTMIVLNLFIGIIVNGMQETQRENELAERSAGQQNETRADNRLPADPPHFLKL